MGTTTEMTVTDHERGLLDAVGATARAENAASAGLIDQIMDYIDARCIFAAAAPDGQFDSVAAERSAIARTRGTASRCPPAERALTIGDVSSGACAPGRRGGCRRA